MSDYTPPPPPPSPPPPPPYGGGPPPPPPPPPPGGGYGGYQQGGPYQGGPAQGGPYPGGPGYPGGVPPKKRGMLPWILGCGGCGLLIVIALVVLGGIGYLGRRAEGGAAGTDTTQAVSSDTTVVEGKPVGDPSSSTGADAGVTTDGTAADGTAADGSAAEPAVSGTQTTDDAPPPADGAEPDIKEIKPVSP